MPSDAPGTNPQDSSVVSFVSTSTGDFHLTSADTIAKNAGVTLSPDPGGRLSFSDDIDGNLRSGTWDIGADEVDETPPIISSVASSTDINTATITWTTNESSTSTVEYGTTISYGSTSSSSASVTSHSIVLTDLIPNTLYHFRVGSQDTTGNATTSVDYTLRTIAPEVTPPIVSITSPIDGASVTGTIAINATASDNDEVASVRFWVDDTVIGTDVSDPYAASLDTTLVANGAHSISAVATDPSGNAATSTITITTNNDLLPPTVSFTSPTDGSTVSSTINLVATASDNVAVASVRFWLNDTIIATDTSSTYAIPIDTTIYANGSYTLSAVATDSSGNAATSTIAVTFDNEFAASSNSNYMGINLTSAADWEKMRVFADIMKTARTWNKADGSGPASVDANGWPTEDAQSIGWGGMDYMNGTYRLSFEGYASLSAPWGVGTFSNVIYTTSTNITTADMTVSGSGSANFLLRFTNTSGGVRNVKLMKPLSPGSSESYASSTEFTSQFTTAVDPFQAIRFMVFTGTNGNQQVEWSDRVPSDFTSYNRTPAGYSWEGRGVAWESVIRLANETQKDAWIDVPINASDDYVQQLATLFRDGNAFTSPLDSDLKLYIEYSNELWNTAGDFGGNPNHDLAIAEQADGLYGYDYDGSGNTWYWAWRRVGRRSVDISNIFRSVFGDAQMMSRIRPVFEWQQANTITGSTALNYVEQYYGGGLSVNHYFYGGGGSAYYGPTDSTSLDNLFTTMDPSTWETALTNNIRITTAFGLKRVAYEGGPSLDATANTSTNAIKELSVNDSRMESKIVDYHDRWSQYGGDLLAYFDLATDYQWGFATDTLDMDTPKMHGIADLNVASRAAITFGNSVSSTVDGGMLDIGSVSWWTPAAGTKALNDGEWASYTFNVPADGVYLMSSIARRTGSVGSIAFLVDGMSFTIDVLSSSAESTPVHNVRLAKGLHSIRLKASGGAISVTSVTLTQ